LPLARNSTDADYLPLLDKAFGRIADYDPQALILQYGVDGHKADRMVGIQLSTYVYEAVAERIHRLAHQVCAGRLVAVGGGGYVPDSVARCWAILLANLTGRRAVMGSKYTALHDRD
jgi:acetoin utilization protein AcuC